MAKTDTLQDSIDLLVLKILCRRGPLHGYGITRHIEQVSGDVLRVEEGSLYPALHRMEESGWIRARWALTRTQRRARVYEVTAEGRKRLELEEARWNVVAGAIARVMKMA